MSPSYFSAAVSEPREPRGEAPQIRPPLPEWRSEFEEAWDVLGELKAHVAHLKAHRTEASVAHEHALMALVDWVEGH